MGWKESLHNIDFWLDGKLDRVPDITGKKKKERPEEYERRVRDRLARAKLRTQTTIRALDDMGDRVAGRVAKGMKRKGGIDGFYNRLLARPKLVVIAMFVIAMLIATQALAVIENMRGDMEIYLPPGHPATVTLEEVNEDWTTDTVVIYIKTRWIDKNAGIRWNVTDVEVLRELSAMESDDTIRDNLDESLRGLNWDRADRGANDGITYVLSIAAMVKTINETPSHIADAAKEQFPIVVVPPMPGNYSIPSQDVVDQIVSGIPPEQMGSLAKDTDGDGIYDTAAIVVGIARGSDTTKVVNRVDKAIKNRMKVMGGGTMKTIPTNTGPYTVIEKMQGRTIFEFLKVLPWLIMFLVGVLFFFHRSIKVAIIALVPVVLALMMTLGIIGALSNLAPDVVIISPQISLIVPILLALGVAYGLYIANRFAEEKKGDTKQRMMVTVKAMNNAILLSAFTTSIGFGSLMIGTLPPIVAMGLALSIGMMLTYAIVMIVVPPLVMLLGYEKKKEFAAWGKFASTPSKNRKKIVAIALVLTAISAYTIPMIKFDADYLAMMPADDPAILAMDDYSKEMGGGMIGMVIIRSEVNDIDTLDAIDSVEDGINDVENSKTLSIVGLMKAIKTPDNLTIPVGGGINIEVPANTSYWELVQRQSIIVAGYNTQEMLIEMFYDILGPEYKWMFINPSYDKTLIYVFMPYLNVEDSRKAVNGVNEAIKVRSSLPSQKMSDLTGVAPLILAINDLIIVSQFQTLALCIFLSFVILTIVFRSWKMGLLTMIPCVLVVSYEPMTLVGLNIPLSIITVMIGSIAIGTGVDFSIQISQRIKLMGMGIKQIRNAVEHMGISFVEATATMVIGFAAVLVGPWPGPGPMGLPFTLGVGIDSVREFVIMIMILLTFNAIMALLVLPALYTLWIRFKQTEAKREEEVKERAQKLEHEEEALMAEVLEEEDVDEPPQIY